MKITIVLGAFLPVPPIMGGAVEKAWFSLGQEFAKAGHEVVQISRALPQFPKTETIAGVQHIRVAGFDTPPSLVRLKFLDLLYSLRVRFVLPSADIIVTNTFWLPMLLRNERRGKVYVHVARYPKGQMRFYSRAARLQTPSQPIARAITSEAPSLERKVRVIPYPRPQSISHDVPSPLSARDKTIVFVGRVHPEKGVHVLLDAFVRNSAVLAGWKLLVIGPVEISQGGGGAEYLRRLQSIAARAPDRVELRGPVFEAAQLEREFRGARLFVYPSLAERGETFGLAALEAMTHGCAVLLSRLECFHDFVSENETGFFFDHHTQDPAQSLAEKLSGLLADESRLARVAEAGYRRSEEFTLAKIAARFLEDFASLQKAR